MHNGEKLMLKTAERIITMSDLQQTMDMIVQNAQKQF